MGYGFMFIGIDDAERHVGQFDVNTVEGRTSICDHYRRSNLEFLGAELDKRLYEETERRYIQQGVESLSQEQEPQRPNNT